MLQSGGEAVAGEKGHCRSRVGLGVILSETGSHCQLGSDRH